jgi:serine/threonine-protein kinase
MSQHIGRQIQGYQLSQLIGEGGTAWVYRAENTDVGRVTAVKILRPELSRRPRAVSRFLTEAEIINRIAHPNLVEVYDVGTTDDGVTYLIMEYLQGRSLAELVRQHGAVPLGRALAVARQLTDALGAAHYAGIVHRDLKPENIYIVEREGQTGFVKMLDFGMAKILGDTSSTHATNIGAIFGTPRYMAPEQCDGGIADQRTDVYALGLVLYMMVAGQPPFADLDAHRMLTKHRLGLSPPLDDRFPGPPALAQVIQRAIALRPADRYPSMEDLDLALAQVPPGSHSAPAAARPASDWPPPPPSDQNTLIEE